MLLLMAMTACGSILPLISSRNIEILLARHDGYAFSERLDGFSATPFVAARERPNYARRSRIVTDGDHYRLEINGKAVCSRGRLVVACPAPGLFDIVQYKYGHRIMHENLCLTAQGVLRMEECAERNSAQEFIFIDESLKYCLESMETPTTMAEEVRNSRIVQAAKKKMPRRLKMMDKSFDDEVERLKPSKEIKKVLKKLWRGWKLGGLKSWFC